MVRRNQNGFAVVEALLIVVVLGILVFTGWFVWHSKQTADKSLQSANKSAGSTSRQASTIKTFDDCKKSAGSRMLETYPEQCVTKDGKKFTDLSQSQKYLVIKEWGVKLKLTDPVLADAAYETPKTVGSAAPGVESVLLATKDTLSFGYTCGGQTSGGSQPVTYTTSNDQDNLLRAKTADELSAASNHPSSDFIKIGDYFYVYQHNTGHGDCDPTDQIIGSKAQQVGNAYAEAAILAE